MGKASRVVILAEDKHQQRFVRKYLYRRGYKNWEIYPEALPSGEGCGEQWVRERYAKWVRMYRGRSARTAIVVVIDADNADVSRRSDQLRDELSRAELSPRSSSDAIAHLIPKRNIETWILCLNGRAVDEDTDYSREPDFGGRIPEAAERFYEWSRPRAAVPAHCVPSLRSAIPDIRRIETTA